MDTYNCPAPVGFFKKHKEAILVALIVGPFSGIMGHTVNQIISTRNVTRMLTAQQNKELLSSTRMGIGFLKRVEDELDENLSFMLTHEYLAKLEFGAPYDTGAAFAAAFSSAATNADQAKSAQAFSEYAKMLSGGPVAKLEKMDVPSEPLTAEVWEHGAPEIADIDYDLLRELSDYYLLVRRVNGSIKALAEYHPGAPYYLEYVKQIKSLSDFHNQNVMKLKEKKIVELKTRIEREMQRLSELRKKVET